MMERTAERGCGTCTLCCRLLPMKAGADASIRRDLVEDASIRRDLKDHPGIAAKVITPTQLRRSIPDFDKPCGEDCRFQHAGKGCSIYKRRPLGCRFWGCRWLANEDTAELERPDKTHYVIDSAPDFVTADDGGTYPVVQVWLDPRYPDAWRDPKLKAFAERRGHEGHATLIRFADRDQSQGIVLFPPALTCNGEWVEKWTDQRGPQHSHDEIIDTIGDHQISVFIGDQ